MSLKNFWYIAARSKELGKRPRPVQLFGEPLVLFRDRRGHPAALMDRCAHRNTELSTGRIIGDCVECPYHGWRYDAAGACTAIPSLGAEAQLPKLRVKAFPCAEHEGY